MFHLTRSSFWRGHLFYAFLPFLCLNVPVISFSSLTFRCFLCFCGNSSDFAVFVSGEILDGLGVNVRMDQVRDIGVAELVRRHGKIEAVNDLPVV